MKKLAASNQLQTRLQAEPKNWLDTGTHDSLLEATQVIAKGVQL